MDEPAKKPTKGIIRKIWDPIWGPIKLFGVRIWANIESFGAKHSVAPSDSKAVGIAVVAIGVVVVIYLCVPKDHSSLLWQGVDSFAGIVTIVIAGALFFTSIRSRWRESLNNVMTVHFVNITKTPPVVEMSIHNATLSSVDDVRAFAQSAGQQITGGVRLDLGIYYSIDREPDAVRLHKDEPLYKDEPPVNRYVVYYPILERITLQLPGSKVKLQNYVVVYSDALVDKEEKPIASIGGVRSAVMLSRTEGFNGSRFPLEPIPLSEVKKEQRKNKWVDWNIALDGQISKIPEPPASSAAAPTEK